MILVAKELSSAEVGLLRTLVRLSTELADRWVLHEDGDCDVLLVGDANPAPDAPHPYSAKVVIPVLPRGETAMGQALARPFRAEDFIALLKRVETTLMGGAQAPDSPLPHDNRTPDGRARLKRWPASQLLRNSRARVQLATMLSRSARSINELSVVSGRSVDECREFIDELNLHELLVWSPVEQTPPPANTAPLKPAPAATGRGLLHSIRRRLGLI